MSSGTNIIKRALNDPFCKVSNPFAAGQDFCQTLQKVVQAANKAFDKADRISVSGDGHFIMDVNEAGFQSPLRPDVDAAYVIFLNIFDTCDSDLRREFAPLPEPGLILSYGRNGKVTCSATKTPLPNEWVEAPVIARQKTMRAENQNGVERFVAAWLRKNLQSAILVEIERQLDKQDDRAARNFWQWSPAQLERKKKLDLK